MNRRPSSLVIVRGKVWPFLVPPFGVVLNKHGNLTGRAAAMLVNHIVPDDPA